ncbi:hypothetical protein [Bradyrhizobium valentinum]|uniref:Uncharacterized protein n=1 Tax=Bradyrhizobium valentinum TaxID=1518501 RepID=A0A0R3L9E0_9BRAD|nr:hypothetical protein [Bradyrhizobium valentinum]KRR03838.1 hypothetical protein CQ10_17995 [Bradyrhizobium valentinum]KRR12440.1 hypothetical protein CP49_08460 [Bradyrhizobium valentinum]
MKRTIAVCLGLLALVSPAAADSPAAVVEDVQGKVTGAEFMDYVTPKAVIKIGDGGSIILSYLKSCRRETISGAGTVIVGAEESAVHLAEVKAEKTNCDSNQANATTRETSGVAATVLRSVDNSKAASSVQAQLTLYGASPLVEAKGRGKLIIRRLDVPGERQEISLGGTQLKGRFLDFASENVALAPGGLYAATFKSSQIVFRVDAQAKPGATPIVGRLLRMQ